MFYLILIFVEELLIHFGYYLNIYLVKTEARLLHLDTMYVLRRSKVPRIYLINSHECGYVLVSSYEGVCRNSLASQADPINIQFTLNSPPIHIMIIHLIL